MSQIKSVGDYLTMENLCHKSLGYRLYTTQNKINSCAHKFSYTMYSTMHIICVFWLCSMSLLLLLQVWQPRLHRLITLFSDHLEYLDHHHYLLGFCLFQVCLSATPFAYLSGYPSSFCLSFFLSFCLSVSLCLYITPFAYLSVCLFVFPFACLSLLLLVCLPLSVCMLLPLVWLASSKACDVSVLLPVCFPVCLSFCLTVSPSACPFLSVHHPVCFLSGFQVGSWRVFCKEFFCLFACLPIRLPVYLPVCLSVCLSICLSACPFACLFSCLPVRLPVCPFVCLSLLLFVLFCLYTTLFAYLSGFQVGS